MLKNLALQVIKLTIVFQKSQGWGIKTFSEIMQEKQKRRRPQDVVETEADSSVKEESKSTVVDSKVAKRLQGDVESAIDAEESASTVSSNLSSKFSMLSR